MQHWLQQCMYTQSLLVSVRAYCHSLTQPLICQVYERAPEFRTCGAGVAMSVNGLKAIKAISPELLAEFEAKGEHCDHVEQLDQHGESAFLCPWTGHCEWQTCFRGCYRARQHLEHFCSLRQGEFCRSCDGPSCNTTSRVHVATG